MDGQNEVFFLAVYLELSLEDILKLGPKKAKGLQKISKNVVVWIGQSRVCASMKFLCRLWISLLHPFLK